MIPAAPILRAEARSARNWLTKTRTGQTAVVGATIAVVVFGLPVGGLVFAFGAYVAHSRSDPARLLGSAFFAVAFLIFVFGLPGVIHAFFADRRLLLLAAAPIRSGRLFWACLARATVIAGGLASLPALLLAFGYGFGRGASAHYYLAVIVLVVMVALMVVAFTLCLMSGVLRVLPVPSARELAALLMGIGAASLTFVQLKVLAFSPSHQTLAIGHQLSSFGHAVAWMPTAWPGEALARWGSGDVADGLAWMSLTGVVTAAVLAAGWRLHWQTFVVGLGVFGDGGGRLFRVRRRPRPARALGHASAARPLIGMARKDLLALRRDFKRLTVVIPVILVAGVYVGLGGSTSRSIGIEGFWSIAAPLLMIPFMVSAAVAMTVVPAEGRSIHLIRLTGLSMGRFLAAKILFAAPVVTAVVVVAALGLAIGARLQPPDILETVVVALWLGAGSALISVAAGALGPKFEADSPRRQLSPLAGLIGMLAEMVFLGFTYGGLALLFQVGAGGQGTVPFAIAGIVLLAAAAAVVVTMVRAGVRSLSRWRFD